MVPVVAGVADVVPGAATRVQFDTHGVNQGRIPGLWILLMLTLSGGPLFAQANNDFAGEWTGLLHEDFEHRMPGPFLGDYTGIPLNDRARLKADSWDAAILSSREHQCIPHPAVYSTRGPNPMRISRVLDPETQQLIAFEIFGLYFRTTRVIWLDGRERPPGYAAHRWQGFSTGEWNGAMLTVETTHLKAGFLQRNGVPTSDRTTMTERFIRNGDYLTVVTMVRDPVYLTEPFIRSTDWILNPLNQLRAFSVNRCDVVDEVSPRPRDFVPHYLPGSDGETERLNEFRVFYEIPQEAARGGAETTYPEYQLKIEELQSRAP